MSKLPKSLTIDQLMTREVPGDVTIADAAAAMLAAEWFKAIKLSSRYPERVRIRFYIGNKEAPGDMTLREFRKTPDIHIHIDDGEGGARVKETV